MEKKEILNLRRDVMRAAKVEQMGMNAALKALSVTKGFAAICKEDGIDKGIFAKAVNFVEYISILPVYRDGVVCRAKAVKDDAGKVVAVEYIPRTSYSPYTIYTLARAAKREREKANK